MDIDFPYHVGSRGRTAETGEADHVRDLIEQVLLTSPGERVNRPDFGCGLLRLVFDPGGPEVAAALAFTVQAALQRWLADVIVPELVQVAADDGALRVDVHYALRRTGERRKEAFSAPLPGGAP